MILNTQRTPVKGASHQHLTSDANDARSGPSCGQSRHRHPYRPYELASATRNFLYCTHCGRYGCLNKRTFGYGSMSWFCPRRHGLVIHFEIAFYRLMRGFASVFAAGLSYRAMPRRRIDRPSESRLLRLSAIFGWQGDRTKTLGSGLDGDAVLVAASRSFIQPPSP
jgi:hypothetical protein